MRFFTLLLCTIFLGFQATAQLESYPQESSMSLGKQPALVLDINEIDKATAIKYWTAYVKEHGKMKKNKKAGEFYAEDIRIPAISSEKFDLYSKVEDLKGNSRLYIWIDTGEMFLTSDNDASTYKNAKGYMDDFAVYAEKEHVESLLKAEEKALSKLEKQMKGLEKDKLSYEKAIEDAKAKIADNEKKIEKNIEDQDAMVTNVENQKHMILKIKERLASIGKAKTKM